MFSSYFAVMVNLVPYKDQSTGKPEAQYAFALIFVFCTFCKFTFLKYEKLILIEVRTENCVLNGNKHHFCDGEGNSNFNSNNKSTT